MPQQKDIVKIAIQMPGALPQLIQLDQVTHTPTHTAGRSGSIPSWEPLPAVKLFQAAILLWLIDLLASVSCESAAMTVGTCSVFVHQTPPPAAC